MQAAPGAGKTTRVPPALLSVCDGDVVVLEPRRIAARLAARRVAQEMGTRLGDEVGYQVRFEEVASKSTRLRFVTEGVLTRRLVADPLLRGVSIVVLQGGQTPEFHIEPDPAKMLQTQMTVPGILDAVSRSTLIDSPGLVETNHTLSLALVSGQIS